jgi:hypothetical protein
MLEDCLRVGTRIMYPIWQGRNRIADHTSWLAYGCQETVRWNINQQKRCPEETHKTRCVVAWEIAWRDIMRERVRPTNKMAWETLVQRLNKLEIPKMNENCKELTMEVVIQQGVLSDAVAVKEAVDAVCNNIMRLHQQGLKEYDSAAGIGFDSDAES